MVEEEIVSRSVRQTIVTATAAASGQYLLAPIATVTAELAWPLLQAEHGAAASMTDYTASLSSARYTDDANTEQPHMLLPLLCPVDSSHSVAAAAAQCSEKTVVTAVAIAVAAVTVLPLPVLLQCQELARQAFPLSLSSSSCQGQQLCVIAPLNRGCQSVGLERK